MQSSGFCGWSPAAASALVMALGGDNLDHTSNRAADDHNVIANHSHSDDYGGFAVASNFADDEMAAAWLTPSNELPPAGVGRVIYVDDDAPPNGHGKSWNKAFRFLQDALDEAWDPGPPPVREIRVARGVYKPDQGASVTPGDTSASFTVPEGVPLRGGYRGAYQGPGNPNERDFLLHESVLSGDLQGNDGPPGSFQNYQDNSRLVVRVISDSQEAIVEGFTVTAGTWGNNYDSPSGGKFRSALPCAVKVGARASPNAVFNITERLTLPASRCSAAS